MPPRITAFPSLDTVKYLSRLLLKEPSCVLPISFSVAEDGVTPWLTRDALNDLLALAQLNHVVVRGLEIFLRVPQRVRSFDCIELTDRALSSERARIAMALNVLNEVCTAFQKRGFDVLVMKTLDHWPDFGSDMDLFTNAEPHDVSLLMEQCFNASIAPRSWGDRLANKWNFLLPDLPEPIEIHIGRLGQTGEQVAIASSLIMRARSINTGGYEFRVPSVSDRLIISTLQRMYRHFNIRLCDIIDNADIADAGLIDYDELRILAKSVGIWEGVATYLVIISDYVESYRGAGIKLPQFVLDAARFRGSEIYYAQGYLRVPLMPHSARLYGSEFAHVLSRGELENCVRLSLLPLLGTAAMAAERITGSDKGIW